MATWAKYDKLMKWFNDQELALGTDALVVRLYLNTSNAATLTIVDASTITNEHANANGYTTGGLALSSDTWTEPVAGEWLLDCEDIQWTASGGPITARYGVVVDTTPTTDRPLALLDFGADKTATDGNPFLITTPGGLIRFV